MEMAYLGTVYRYCVVEMSIDFLRLLHFEE